MLIHATCSRTVHSAQLSSLHFTPPVGDSRLSMTEKSPRRDADQPLGVSVQRHPQGGVLTIVLHRPAQHNAVDGDTARALFKAFREAEADSSIHAIVLYGAGGTFCAGGDLKALSSSGGVDSDPATSRSNPLTPVQSRLSDNVRVQPFTSDIGPMGPTRMQLTKPVIAAIAGHAVAGGLELACWADMRVAEEDAILGVFCRRFGVPLIDGGTVRLPRLIGLSRAMDLILTGRPVDAKEALQSVQQAIGLVNRVVPAGTARSAAEALALSLCAFPQRCLRGDRWSALHQHGKSERLALEHESAHALAIVREESVAGAARFARGQGRHGRFETPVDGSSLATRPASAVPPSNSVAVAAVPSAASDSGRTHGRISCVLFDLGGVVVDSPVAEILAHERRLGLPPHTLNGLLARSAHFHALERGEIDLHEMAPLLEAEARSRGLAQPFDALQLFAHMGAVRVRPSMIAAIAALRSAGVIVGAVTNNWRTRRTDARGVMMHDGAVDGMFDFVVESALVGSRKPEQRIFQMALERCAAERHRRGGSGGDAAQPAPMQPAEVVFLDDLGVNLKAARACGLTTIKVTADYAVAIKQLAELTGVDLSSSSSSSSSPLQSKL